MLLAENLIHFHFFYCLKVDTVRAKNVLPVIKSNFLALAKEVSPLCLCRSSACSRERSELPPGFFSLTHPADAPAGRTDCHHRDRNAGGQDCPLKPPPGGQRVYFIIAAVTECLFYCTRFLPSSHRLCCSLCTLSSENISSWCRSPPLPEA